MKTAAELVTEYFRKDRIPHPHKLERLIERYTDELLAEKDAEIERLERKLGGVICDIIEHAVKEMGKLTVPLEKRLKQKLAEATEVDDESRTTKTN